MRRVAAALVLGASLLAACSVASDNSPRDIDAKDLDLNVQDPSDVGQAAAGAGRIYLLAPDVPGQPSRLRSVARDIDDDPAAVMAALLAGPNSNEFEDRFRSGLPSDTQVLGITRRSGGVLALDLNDAITQLRGDELILALAQIVYSLSEVSGVTGVVITVEGADTRWPASSGELQSDPLTVYDYPGLEPSTQPAYPAVPSEQ
ncbi:MAG: GerMN domain-containing protein [Ilumatobacteraceae bacterium]